MHAIMGPSYISLISNMSSGTSTTKHMAGILGPFFYMKSFSCRVSDTDPSDGMWSNVFSSSVPGLITLSTAWSD